MPRSKLEITEADVDLMTRTLFRYAAAIVHKLHENGFTSVQVHSTGFGSKQRQLPMIYVAVPVGNGINADMLAWITTEFSENSIQINTGPREDPFLMIWCKT